MRNNTFDLISKFIDNLKNNNKSPSTILAYKSDLEQLKEFLVKQNIANVEEVKTENLETFRDTLLAQKFTSKTVSRKLNAVKTFFRWLVNNNYLTTDVSKNVAHPKIENSLPKFLTPLEYRALRDIVKTDSKVSAMIELTLQTGIRISELANLKIKNINENSLTIEGYATQKERIVPLNKPAKDALDRYFQDRPKTDSEYLFTSKNGKSLAVRNIRASIDRFMQKAGLPKYFVNDLRTTFIVENIKAGVDLVLISQIAGHKRISTTEKYLELAKMNEAGKKQELTEL